MRAQRTGWLCCFSHLAALGVAVACAVTAACAGLAPAAEATPPANPSAILRIHPGGGPVRFGDSQTLEAEVSTPSGAGIDGVEVDLEVTGGPGDQDGDTPQTPDMSCTTAGGDAHHPATCSVSYAEPLNQAGSDGVLAWIDRDGDDSTVEADLGEGENENAPGSGGCAPGTKGPGDTPEPDGTDCVEKRWVARAAIAVDLEPKASSGAAGSVVDLVATVLDQFGDPFGDLPGSSTTVSFELLAGSAHDPGDGSDFSSPDLGSCVPGSDGTCSVPFTAGTAGTDIVCAYLPGASTACSQAADAPGAGVGGQVVTRSWGAPVPPAPDAPVPPAPDAPVPPAPSGQVSDPQPQPTDEIQPPDGPQHSRRPREGAPDDRPQQPAQTPDAVTPQTALPAPAPAAQPVQAPQNPQPLAPAPRRPAHRTRHSRRPRGHRRSHIGAVQRSRGGKASFGPRDQLHRPPRHHRHHATPTLGVLSRAALTTAHKLSFPLGLTVLVIAFLAVQGRLDRRDPKLRLAPVDSKHDLLPFA